MGFLEDAKDTVDAAAKKVGRAVEDGMDKVGDKVDEVKADAKVRQAEAEAESVRAKNDAKDALRDDK